MCYDFTDNYIPHIAIERDYNFYCVGKFLRYKILRMFYCIKVLISSTKFSSS